MQSAITVLPTTDRAAHASSSISFVESSTTNNVLTGKELVVPCEVDGVTRGGALPNAPADILAIRSS